LQIGRRIGGLGVDGDGGAQLTRQSELAVIDVDGRDVEAHGLGILHGHMAQAADAGITTQSPGLASVTFSPLYRDPGAEHGSDVDKAHVGRQMAHIVGIGQCVVGKAAVDRIAGIGLRLAQGFPAAYAVAAEAAGAVKPGHAHAIAFLDMLDVLAHRRHIAHALVAGNEGRMRLDRPVAFGCMQIGVADAGSSDLDQDLIVCRSGHRHFFNRERLPEGTHHGGFHGLG
jgi:hypothetical protein